MAEQLEKSVSEINYLKKALRKNWDEQKLHKQLHSPAKYFKKTTRKSAFGNTQSKQIPTQP